MLPALTFPVAYVNANDATNNGGAIYLAAGSTLTASDGFIGSITSGGGSTALNGAGLYVDASTVNFEGYIYNNIATTRGGGIYASGSTLNLTSADVGGLHPVNPTNWVLMDTRVPACT